MNEKGETTGLLSPPVRVEEPGDVLLSNPLIHPSVMARTEWFKSHRYNQKLRRSQDFDLWVRSIEDSSFASLADPLLFYRFTGVFSWQKFREHNRIRRSIIRKHGPKLMGRFKTEKLLFQRWLKGVAGGVLNAVGLWGWAMARKTAPLTPAQRAHCDDALRTIRQINFEV
jgi:hypothetical protein